MLASPQLAARTVARLRAAGCVFAEEEAQLLLAAASCEAELDGMVERRASGVPVEHVVGWAEFAGQRIPVAPGVFVPRARSAFLAEQAVALAPPRPVVVDLCCGSGALGAVVAGQVGGTELHAVDLDPAAVACARANLAAFGGHVYEGDLFEPLPADLHGRLDLVVVNPPYVPSDEVELMPRETRYEPRGALDGGSDGLTVARRVVGEAARWLAPGGWLLLETSRRQAPYLLEAATASGLVATVSTSDELDATVVTASRPQPAVP